MPARQPVNRVRGNRSVGRNVMLGSEIVSSTNATLQIPDGALVEIDGTFGTVTLLPSGPST